MKSLKRIFVVLAILGIIFVGLVPSRVYAQTERYAKFRIFYDVNGDGIKNGSDTWASGIDLHGRYLIEAQCCNWQNTGTKTTDSNGYVTFFSGAPSNITIYLIEVQVDDPTNQYWTTTACPTQVSYSATGTANIYRALGIHTGGCSGEG